MGARFRPFIAILAAGVVVTGCGTDNPAPKPLPPATSSATAAPSPSDSASPTGTPTLPAEAQGLSKSAAKAFVRLYVEQLNAAAESGDTRLLHLLYTRSCDNCTALAKLIDTTYAAGGSFKGEPYRLQRVFDVRPGPGGKIAVFAQWRVLPQVHVPSQGAAAKRYAGGKSQVELFTLVPRGGDWRILTYYTERES